MSPSSAWGVSFELGRLVRGLEVVELLPFEAPFVHPFFSVIICL